MKRQHTRQMPEQMESEQTLPAERCLSMPDQPRGRPKPKTYAKHCTPAKQVYRANLCSQKADGATKSPPSETVMSNGGSAPRKKKSLLRGLISDLLFFSVLLGVVFGVGMYKQMFKGSGNILGYYFYSVLSGSMQRDIPKGSLVVVKATPKTQLQIGDDITFYRDPTTVITHRIIQVVENYENSGGRGFVTQGIENPMPDEDMVHEANVVGKVIQVIPNVGYAATIIGANLKWVVLFLGLLFVLATNLRVFFSKGKTPEDSAEENNSHPDDREYTTTGHPPTASAVSGK